MSRYKQAGVDIDAGDALVEAIKPLAKSTARPGSDAGLGGFGAFFDLARAGYTDPVLVATTDGVGTKLKLAIETGHLNRIDVSLEQQPLGGHDLEMNGVSHRLKVLSAEC